MRGVGLRRALGIGGPLALVVALGACTHASTTAVGSTARASATSSQRPTPAPSPTCAPAVVTTTPPTDFPHAVTTPQPVSTADAAADAALARNGLAALTAFGGPVSASAFKHYLDATGSYLALPVDRLLTASPTFVTDLDTALVSAAAGAVQQVLRAPTSTCPSVTFSSGWLSHDDVADPDWRYTLGRFRYQVLGVVTRAAPGAAGVRVTYRAAIGDTYDFDPGSTFAEFATLAAHGRAAVFLDGGLTTTRAADVTGAAALAAPGFG